MYKNNAFIKKDDVNVNFISFKTLCDSYIASLQAVLKPSTISRYEVSINLFKPLYEMKANQITPTNIISWQKGLMNQYSVSTLNNAKVVIGAIFNYGIDTFKLLNNPAKRVKRIKDFKADNNINYISLE